MEALVNSFGHSSYSTFIFHSGFFPMVEAASLMVVGVSVGSCPFLGFVFTSMVCFLMTKRKSGWGICGSSVVAVM